VTEHREERRRYRLDLAWRVPAAAGAVLAGLVAGTVNPGVAAQGVQWATGILSTTERGLLPPTPPSEEMLEVRIADAESKLAVVADEAQRRRVAAERRLRTQPRRP
jgi:hypothetical protein